MKRILIHITLIISLCELYSCNDFLELSSQDLIIPTTVSHYKELLQGEAYFKDLYHKSWFIDMMTDDVEYYNSGSEAATCSYIEMGEYIYKWQPEIEVSLGEDKLFQHLYKNILVANICIEDLDDLEGTIEEKEILSGQAYFTRAYGYFVLANLYAKTYSQAEDDDLCVPIILDPTPSTKKYNRATIKEIWNLIKTDSEKAVSLLKNKRITNKYEINYKAALILASRIALFMEDFEDVITHGENYLTQNSFLSNISDTTTFRGNDSSPKFIHPINEEIVLLFGEENNFTHQNIYNRTSRYYGEFFIVSQNSLSSLKQIYYFDKITNEGDKRYVYWFNHNSSVYFYPLKYDLENKLSCMYALRGGEVYLNLAEAYARKSNPDMDKALDLLNTLRSNRISSYENLKNSDFVNTDEYLKFIWEERRRELCFEEFHRWWDLRRTEQPEIIHHWRDGYYKLEKNDPAYILNFPQYEREFNPNLIGNYRPERKKNN